MSLTASVLALLAALTAAMGAVLQSRGVHAVKEGDLGAAGLLSRLVRMPLWWLGVALTGPVVAVFHTAALDRGTLIEVEAVMVSSLLFALALGALITHQSVSRRDWWSAVIVVVGLALFLGSADPYGDDYAVPVGQWVVVGVVVTAAVVLLGVAARRSTRPNVRAASWGTAAGVLLGTSAVLLKYVSTLFGDGLGAIVTSPALWALAAAELVALVCQQLAFRSGFAAALAPIVGGNPLVAGLIGVIIYHERFHRTPVDLAIAGTGLALVGIGIALLTISPMVAVGSGEVAPAGADD
ncbi:MAG: hypothetical protein FJW95_11315 [Actinobacteria bacterium]|nr:hypothetical protein [Actinomycetota bacterium]